MTSLANTSLDKCSFCDAPLSDSLRHCPTCQRDAGAPNVRACSTENNLKALEKRFNDANARALDNKCQKEFADFSKLIMIESGVVIAMPANMARTLVEDSKKLYVNYDNLVGSGIRKPAEKENDRQRSTVSGMIFGTYANKIIYGALSLTAKGLPTYGDVYCRLRNVAIDMRTSFLEANSHKFVENHNLGSDGRFPDGFTASWEDRHKLVLAKLVDQLNRGQTKTNWQEILIKSNGKDRKADDFVEAHIYENFDINAIESMVVATDKRLSRGDRLDLDLALEKFKKIGEKK